MGEFIENSEENNDTTLKVVNKFKELGLQMHSNKLTNKR